MSSGAVTRDGRVLRLRVARGKHGTLDGDALPVIAEALNTADPAEIGAALLVSEGASFCTGGDVRAFADAADRGAYVAALAEAFHEVVTAIATCAVPVVAAVPGWAAGAGMSVVCAVDLAVAGRSTVVTVCWVDWDFPDAFGFREHRVLNWLELHNMPWEEQYFTIVEFLDNYSLAYVGVDAQAMGTAIAERLQLLMGSRCEVLAMTSEPKTQGTRWKNLQTLIDRRLLVYPGHSKARRTRVWRRFRQQMSDVVKVFRGGHMLVEAPKDEYEARDDYVDSVALACSCSMTEQVDTVESAESPFYAR
jgi:hypothetical protein